MRVCFIGTEYIGLVTGACLAYVGHDVIFVEPDATKVALMRSGKPPLFELGLEDIMHSTMEAGRLEFTTNFPVGVTNAQVVFIAVENSDLADEDDNVASVEAVAREIGLCLSGDYKVIVNKSSVPIGLGERINQIILAEVNKRQLNNPCQFDVVSNPEFIREGSAIYDTFYPDRIVLGSHSQRAIKVMKELYTPIIEGAFGHKHPLSPLQVVVTGLNSAERLEQALNNLPSTKISFINAVTNICLPWSTDSNQVA